MKAYDIWFKKAAKARKVYVWTRYAENAEQARESALNALNDEYYGEAELVSVIERVNMDEEA